MCKKLTRNFCFTFLTLCLSCVSAQAMELVKGEKKNTCDPCFIQASLKKKNHNKKIRVQFTLKKEEGMKRVQAVSFNYGKGKKQTDIIVNDNLGWREPAEKFPFYSLDLNKDGFKDLALQVFARNGLKYEYWIYNPKSKKYIYQKRSIFELSRSVEKGKAIYSNEAAVLPDGGESYILNKKYQLIKQ